MERQGLVERHEKGRRVCYCAVGETPRWNALRQVIREFADPVEVIEEALAGLEGLDAAFVFGSFARGDVRKDSDIDVMVVGRGFSVARLGRQAAEVSVLLGRPVEIRSYSREKLRKQLRAGNAVLRRILSGPKRWIGGDESRLRVIAA